MYIYQNLYPQKAKSSKINYSYLGPTTDKLDQPEKYAHGLPLHPSPYPPSPFPFPPPFLATPSSISPTTSHFLSLTLKSCLLLWLWYWEKWPPVTEIRAKLLNKIKIGSLCTHNTHYGHHLAQLELPVGKISALSAVLWWSSSWLIKYFIFFTPSKLQNYREECLPHLSPCKTSLLMEETL